MAFYINTNIASLQAQNYLNQTNNFQNQTIQEVTSGLRIVNSGNDAAGLAIANGYRSDEAVLTQGVQNASNGLSQLQIADGGISRNISQLLDRARTLATESASGTFHRQPRRAELRISQSVHRRNYPPGASHRIKSGRESFAENVERVHRRRRSVEWHVRHAKRKNRESGSERSTVDAASLGLVGCAGGGRG